MTIGNPEHTRVPSSLGAELARFGLVGGLTNVVYFGLLWLLRGHLQLRWGLAGGVAYGLSMVVNYLLQRAYTFRSQGPHLRAGHRYVVTQAVGLGINSGILELLLEQRLLDALLGPELSAYALEPRLLPDIPLRFVLGQGIALAANVTWSYLTQKFWVFRDH
jgi:putative flippase GtrA